jgi:5-methylcytosine-specific restriction endonuclease McrA
MYLAENEKVSRKKIPHQEIANYWDSNVCELDLNIDFSEALTHCWACGYKHKLEAAHIIPHCLGGECIPSNLVLLCKKCNLDNPHSLSREDFWNWIKTRKEENKDGLYDTSNVYKIYKEYKLLYDRDLEEECLKIFLKTKYDFAEELKSFIDINTKHYFLSNLSSKAVFFKNFLSHIENKYANSKLKTKIYIRYEDKNNIDEKINHTLFKYCETIRDNFWIIEDPVNNPDICDKSLPITQRKYLTRVVNQSKEKLFDILIIENFSVLGDSKIQKEIFNILKENSIKIFSISEKTFLEGDNLETNMNDIENLMKEIEQLI